MASADTDRQIRQMVEFITLEAKEKAAELRAKAAADAQADKQLRVENEIRKISEDYERKEKALAVEQKIAASMEEQRQRARLLGAREQFIQKLATEAKTRLAAVAGTNQGAYNNLLKGLIKQGILRLENESKVQVHARPQDLAVAQKAAAAAAQEVLAEAKAAGAERSLTVNVIADPALGGSAGGVTLSTQGGRITCDNTLEARLSLATADLTPVVRDLLFPSARAEVRTKPAIKDIHGNVLPPTGAAAHAHAPAPAAKPAAAHAPAPAPAAVAAADPFGTFGGAGGGAGGAAYDPFGQ